MRLRSVVLYIWRVLKGAEIRGPNLVKWQPGQQHMD